jgi:tetratricopeptide (TPR) repeat protein
MTSKTRKQQIEEMLVDEPNDPFLRYGLAMELVSAGDLEGALQCFHDLFAVAPTFVPGYHQAGQLLNRLGRTDEARDVLRRGIVVAGQLGDTHAAGEMEGLLDSL